MKSINQSYLWNTKRQSSFLLIAILFLCSSCGQWMMPKDLAGTWEARQKVSVRYSHGISNFSFVSDTVNIMMNINEEGKVSGKVGEAEFTNCSVSKNRNDLGRKINIATDYVIKGKLIGNIFSKDTIPEKEISIPFNKENNTTNGTLFHKTGIIDLYPMANFKLIKK